MNYSTEYVVQFLRLNKTPQALDSWDLDEVSSLTYCEEEYSRILGRGESKSERPGTPFR